MKKAMYLHIPEPCHENWNAMTPVQQGRFCQSCSKTVVDFSNMADQQIIDTLKKAAGNTCGRFTENQLARPLVKDIPLYLQPHKLFLAAFIPAFFSSVISTAQTKLTGKVAMNNKPVCSTAIKGDTIYSEKPIKGMTLPVVVDKTPTPSIETKVNNEATKGEVTMIAGGVKSMYTMPVKEMKGLVLNEAGEPIPFATIEMNERDTIVADIDGSFSFQLKGNDKNVKVSASSIGYASLDSNLYIPVEMNEPVILMLKYNVQLLGEVVVTSAINTYKGRVYMGGAVAVVHKVVVMDTAKTVIQKLLKKEMFNLYPNPIVRGNEINMVFRKAGKYTLAVFDNHGKLYTESKIEIQSDKQVYLFPLSVNIIAGSYFIKAINNDTKKQFTEKLIIQ